MKKNIYIAAMALLAVPAMAQETYVNANLATEDLNGTARYVGMGGAMEALGADISTIHSNPAGLGLFRKSNFSLSAGMVSQEDGKNFGGGNVTNVSFDQVGFVWANQISATDFVNFSFNYHKSRNFNQFLHAADALDHASQNKLTYAKDKMPNDLLYEYSGQRPLFNRPYLSCSLLDDMYAQSLLYQPTDPVNPWGYYDGDAYNMDRSHSGYIGEYDFSLSGNVNNSFYWGITIGVHDVHYKHYGEYSESLIGDDNYFPTKGTVTVADDRSITGSGADIKLGAIVRPVAESPFRFGIYVSTPTWYSLTTSNYTTLSSYGRFSDGTSANRNLAQRNESYRFKLYTPWKFGLSLGHTIGTQLAMGLSYEFADYGSIDSRYRTDGDYDDYDDSESDEDMNRHTSATLKGVSTLKMGVEYKPDPALAVRFGYNYVSPMYKKGGYLDPGINSEGVFYSTTTDYTNWEATHRFTCGLGFQTGQWNLGVAYQYSAQNGRFSPFTSYDDEASRFMHFTSYDDKTILYDDCVVGDVKVSNKRHQVLLTANYTF